VGAAAVAIGIATLLPSSGRVPSFGPFCIACGELGSTDFVLNVLLFLPLGLGLGLGATRPVIAISGMVAATVTVELLQVFIPGRAASLGDVLANSLGGTLGFLVAVHRAVVLRPPQRVERVLVTLWSIAWLAIMTISAYAFMPSPTHSRYYGLIARDLGPDLPGFPGKVLDPRIDTLRIPDWEVSDRVVRRLLVQLDGATVQATLVPAACPTTIAGILQIADAEQRRILLMGQDGADLVFGVRTGADVLRLRPIYYALDGVFGDSDCHVSNDTIRVAASYSRATISLRSNLDQHLRLASSLSATVMNGWRLFTPRQTFIRAEYSAQVFGALWLFFLSLPFGYLVGTNQGRSRIAERIAILVLLACGLLVVPKLFGIAASDTVACSAAIAGVLVGAMGRRYAARQVTQLSRSDHQ
jgi:glycopeptide antibiotics resistance protein